MVKWVGPQSSRKLSASLITSSNLLMARRMKRPAAQVTNPPLAKRPTVAVSGAGRSQECFSVIHRRLVRRMKFVGAVQCIVCFDAMT